MKSFVIFETFQRLSPETLSTSNQATFHKASSITYFLMWLVDTLQHVRISRNELFFALFSEKFET